ncbi:MAG: hypothetical protein ACREF9_18675 [Opitutaceae bacterium]
MAEIESAEQIDRTIRPITSVPAVFRTSRKRALREPGLACSIS